MINKQDISSIILKKDTISFKEQDNFYTVNGNIYIDKTFLDNIYEKFKVIDCTKENKKCDSSSIIFVDEISVGLLNFGWYIKLINFLNDYNIKPILIFNSFSIHEYFIEALKNISNISEYEIIFKHIDNENFIRIKNKLLEKYNTKNFLLTSIEQLTLENDFENYYLLLHDDFLDQYDSPWTHANKIKKELFDSKLIFFNLVLKILGEDNIKVLTTDYIYMLKNNIKFNLIKPYSNYPDTYSPKEDKYIQTFIKSNEYLKPLDEIKLTLDYKEISNYMYIEDSRFNFFNIKKIFTDDYYFAEKSLNKNKKVFLFNDSYNNPNIHNLVTGEFSLYDNLEIIITAVFEDQDNEDKFYSNIRDVLNV